MAKKKVKKSKKKTQKLESDSKLFAFLATFLSIVGFVIAILVKKDDKYVMYYAKQSLIVFIAYVISVAVIVVPIIGWIAGPILYVFTVVLWIISWASALTGKKKEVPFIGKYSKDIKL